MSRPKRRKLRQENEKDARLVTSSDLICARSPTARSLTGKLNFLVKLILTLASDRSGASLYLHVRLKHLPSDMEYYKASCLKNKKSGDENLGETTN